MKTTCRSWTVLAAILLSAPAAARIGDPSGDFPTRDPRPIYATEAPNRFLHNIGGLTLQLTNLGIIGNPYNNELSLGWRGYEYLSQASLWVGAISEDGMPHVSSSVAGTKRLEFRPSRLALDTFYSGYEGMPQGNRDGFFSPDDDGDGQVHEDFLNGRDDDGDGRIDEDFSAIGQQMLTCEYRDDTPEALAQIPDHVPLGLKVQQRSFQWSENGVNEFVGLDFNIVNIGDQRLKDVYIGLYVDGDIGPRNVPGYFEDDQIGTTSFNRTVTNPLLMDYLLTPEGQPNSCVNQSVSGNLVYMWDTPDDETGSPHGDAPGFLGCMYLGSHSETQPSYFETGKVAPPSAVRWTASQAPYPEGDPRTDEERYDFMSSSSGGSGGRSPGDYRFMMSAGPYEGIDPLSRRGTTLTTTLNPGESIRFEAALLIGSSLGALIQNAVTARLIYDGTRVDADHDPSTGIEGKERCLRAGVPVPRVIVWDDPCDGDIHTLVNWTETTCLWVNDDCDTCSGMNGRELILHWQGLSIPPEPAMNTGPDILEDRNPETRAYYEAPGRDRKIVLQWDNRPEVRLDPYTGTKPFEGYRIWRVDNWTRPKGAVGPAPDDWKLLAEFRKSPRDGLGVGSPLHLRRIEHSDRGEIREMTPGGPLYHVGRYEWPDTAGIVNGKVYYYSVTAFSVVPRIDPNSGGVEEEIIGGLPTASQKELVMATWSPGEGCGSVRVVPNPYRGGADWDLETSDCDASGTRIAFRSLPEDWERIDIYSVSGDLVFTGLPGESRVVGGCEAAENIRSGGTFFWDLISRNGQDVTSGIYLYAIEAGGETCRGRFVVIR